MTLLLDIAPYIQPVSPQTPGAEVYERFQLEPDTLAIAVVDDHGDVARAGPHPAAGLGRVRRELPAQVM